MTLLNDWDLSALRYSFIRMRTWCIPTGSEKCRKVNVTED